MTVIDIEQIEPSISVLLNSEAIELPNVLDKLTGEMFDDELTKITVRQLAVSGNFEITSYKSEISTVVMRCEIVQQTQIGIAVVHYVSTDRFIVFVVGNEQPHSGKLTFIINRLQKARERLLNATDEVEFKKILLSTSSLKNHRSGEKIDFSICSGMISDLRRRLPYYLSDFSDGLRDTRSVYKTTSTTFFLFFSILLPLIAFGTLNSTNTNGSMNVRKTLTSQTFGGLFFALFSGQPLVILMTTAPLSLYIKVIYNISEQWNTDFATMYAIVGLSNSFFLIVYSAFNASHIMRWCTRSTEEIFSLFITVAFFVDAGKDAYHNFERYYRPCEDGGEVNCHREVSLLFLLLMLATLWLSLSLFNFRSTAYLAEWSRQIVSDYALPLAVILMSLVGVLLFSDIRTKEFSDDANAPLFLVPKFQIETKPLLIAIALGFPLSLLFLMDQNISAAMVDTPEHKLVKGSAFDWDILIVSILNGLLSICCFPWMHGVLPHSPLHAKAMADVESTEHHGHVVVKSRETRLTSLFSHILIGLSLLLLPQPLGSIPTAVLDGLFLYMAVSSLQGNQFFERFLLLFTERKSYPPYRYVTTCPTSSIHIFTAIQLGQLCVFIFFGFSPWPYVTMAFPLIIMALLVVRQVVVPKIISDEYLDQLDSKQLHEDQSTIDSTLT